MMTTGAVGSTGAAVADGAGAFCVALVVETRVASGSAVNSGTVVAAMDDSLLMGTVVAITATA